MASSHARVVVLPGHGFGHASTLPMRSFLRARGHRAGGWGLGANRRAVRWSVDALIDALGERSAPVALVGQSLGGFVAREVARTRPDLVAQVITLGSPVLRSLSPQRLTVPVLALWSPDDTVVRPSQATQADPMVELRQIRGGHYTMGVDARVWWIVDRALRAEPHQTTS